MIPRFSDVLSAINDLIERGLIQDYAIFGAVAQAFWDEAIPTFDLDVLILTGSPQGALISLAPLDGWAKERGYNTYAEHIVIGEVPVQFVPAPPDPLSEEAVARAATLPFDGLPVKVVRAEYLIALWLQPPANNAERKQRAAKLRESVKLDQALIDDLFARYNLSW